MSGKSDALKKKYNLLLGDTLIAGEGWLMERILDYAKKQGYVVYTSTLKEAWRLSISGLTTSILESLKVHSDIPEMTPEEDFSQDPVVMFGVIEAQRHRERGVSLNMFLGLMKYYRQSYIDLVRHENLDENTREYCELYINRVFDRIEIGFCGEWSGAGENKAIHEMQINNRMMTNEKNKYLTIFESIPTPIIILNPAKKIDNMNLAAASLFQKDQVPGGQYYCVSRDRHLEQKLSESHAGKVLEPSCFGGAQLYSLLPWLEKETEDFLKSNMDSASFEKEVDYQGCSSIFRIRFAKNLDVSGKFAGTIIIMEDVTSLKHALDEIKTLRSFLPICSYCKSVRDDEGYWKKIEAYVSDRWEAEFSHSICPDCAKKHFPGIDLYSEDGKIK